MKNKKLKDHFRIVLARDKTRKIFIRIKEVIMKKKIPLFGVASRYVVVKSKAFALCKRGCLLLASTQRDAMPNRVFTIYNSSINWQNQERFFIKPRRFVMKIVKKIANYGKAVVPMVLLTFAACKKGETPQPVQNDIRYEFGAGNLPAPPEVKEIEEKCKCKEIRYIYLDAQPLGWSTVGQNSRAGYVKRAEDYFDACPNKMKTGRDFTNEDFYTFTIDQQGRLQFLGFNKQH